MPNGSWWCSLYTKSQIHHLLLPGHFLGGGVWLFIFLKTAVRFLCGLIDSIDRSIEVRFPVPLCGFDSLARRIKIKLPSRLSDRTTVCLRSVSETACERPTRGVDIERWIFSETSLNFKPYRLASGWRVFRAEYFVAVIAQFNSLGLASLVRHNDHLRLSSLVV